uniref:Uncharacterized protein n=1 Tax=Anguilla anguilla TaxID=7936 RepID=A0A0E9RE13_ANGAN
MYFTCQISEVFQLLMRLCSVFRVPGIK